MLSESSHGLSLEPRDLLLAASVCIDPFSFDSRHNWLLCAYRVENISPGIHHCRFGALYLQTMVNSRRNINRDNCIIRIGNPILFTYIYMRNEVKNRTHLFGEEDRRREN